MEVNTSINNKETKLVIEGKEFEIYPFKIERTPRWYIPELRLVIELRKKNENKAHPHNYCWNGTSGGIGNNFEEKPLENMIDYAKDLIADLEKCQENLLKEIIKQAEKDKNLVDKYQWNKELKEIQEKLNRACQGLGELKFLQQLKQNKRNDRKN